jgi:AcrR family transcriptional regulator
MISSLALGFRLANADLEGAHVCGLFDGADDTYAQLAPFIADGLVRGLRAVHIVEPSRRDDHIERLASAGIDIGAALERRQLDVRTWLDLYLVDGRFQPERTVRLLKTMLDEGRAFGYAATRAIGFMEWALERGSRVDAITSYEALLETELRAGKDTVVCAYDVRRHRPLVIADMLDLHPYAWLEGRLRTRVARRGPRDRILATAARLFHRHGIAATGIDRVIAEAGVAKATFYRQFPSKDELVLAWIRDSATRWFDRVFARAEQMASSPEMLIPAVFDALAEWLELDGYRGCPYLNVIAELADVDANNRVRMAATAYLDEIRDQLRDAATAAGADRSTGDGVHILLAGAIELAAASRSTAPIETARDAAAQMLSLRLRSADRRARRRAAGP